MNNLAMSTGNTKLNVRPIKFVVWLIVVSSTMFFAAFTSSYIVRKAEGNWVQFELPKLFILSTIFIVLSSITLHWALICAKRLDFGKQKLALWITFFLGVGFLISQYLSWQELVAEQVMLVGNPSGSFLYIISGSHGIHIIAGLLMVVASIAGVYAKIPSVRNTLRLELTSIFWHFLDLIWIYLYVFLLFNH